MQLVHVGRAHPQVVMIHVWGHAFPICPGPDINDGLGGDPGRGKAHLSGPELLEPQDLQAEHVAIKVDRLFNVLGIHYHMVQSHHVHGSLPRGFPCQPGFAKRVHAWIVAAASATG
jgi:hypothetical protein